MNICSDSYKFFNSILIMILLTQVVLGVGKGSLYKTHKKKKRDTLRGQIKKQKITLPYEVSTDFFKLTCTKALTLIITVVHI